MSGSNTGPRDAARTVVSGGVGMTSVCQSCTAQFAVERLGDFDCACGARYTVIFPVDERWRVKPKVVTTFADDFHYVALCPACLEEFTGGRPALGDRLCPHCKAPVRVEV